MKTNLDIMRFYDWQIQLIRYLGIDHKYYYLARIRRGKNKTWGYVPYYRSNKHRVYENGIVTIKLKELVGKKWDKKKKRAWLKRKEQRESAQLLRKSLKKPKSTQ